MRAMMRFFVAFTALACVSPALAKGPILAQHEMVSAASPLAAQAGFDVLKAGGSAVDAAVAVQSVLTLVEPESSGIGGGAFMLVWDPKTKTLTTFNGRETAPASATPAMFLNGDGTPMSYLQALPGGRSVGVPGDVAMLALAQKKFGKLAWSKLFDAVVRNANAGIPISPKLAEELHAFPMMGKMPAVHALFYKADGTPLAQGDILKNPALAKTMQQIAQGGPDVFYHGPIAQEIADAVTHAPVNAVTMTLGDIAAYKAEEKPALCGTYRGFRVCAPPPPSSGGVTLLQMLSILEHYQSAQLKPQTVLGIHLISQASRLAYADRDEYLGDPDFVRMPLDGLLNATYLTSRAKLISLDRDMGTASFGTPPTKRADLIRYVPNRFPGLHGTSHFTIVDKNGEVVSMTTSIEFILGSELSAGGFMLNNELTDFSFEPERDGKPVANAVASGKRPLSSMTPVIVFDRSGAFAFALGSPGGKKIIPYVAEAVSAMIDGRLNIQQAAELPHHVNTNGPLELERDTPLIALTPQFQAMGYTVNASSETSGTYGIAHSAHGYEGGADPRRDGVAIGD
ncbi:MAG TPA: gamma-glutamyltransferase [Rhizomicrobium sp.]|jgi:gamma-glutamyltranspeptidase/glutathione hydrolase|nr:gamma-glutamyltransferase [Rhizomicrobium sp.]